MKKADRKKERFRNEWKYLISTSEKSSDEATYETGSSCRKWRISDTEPVF